MNGYEEIYGYDFDPYLILFSEDECLQDRQMCTGNKDKKGVQEESKLEDIGPYYEDSLKAHGNEVSNTICKHNKEKETEYTMKAHGETQYGDKECKTKYTDRKENLIDFIKRY